ncbi:hypothetical protein D4764_03G0004680 [Takifugu flavidus]|uniref:Ig-like domain-containing protein n=1 Tax=Takifugu flavidus TaxID=433684 RepID=A0A5C6NC31_9TELE|nr:hypothetical protein D4764_03G0004680 [Takifugu flavidus]
MIGSCAPHPSPFITRIFGLVFILCIAEVLTALPVLTSNSTRDTLTRVCTVLLECSSEATGGVTYRWTVRNQTITGPSLTYTIREEDGDTVFNCTVGNIVSEVSASKVLNESGATSPPLTSPPLTSVQEYDFGPGHLEKIMEKKDHTNTKGGWKKKMGSSKKKDWIGLN